MNMDIIDEHLLWLRRMKDFISNYNNITLNDKITLMNRLNRQITFICKTLYVPQTLDNKCKFSFRNMYNKNFKYIKRG